MAPGLDIATSKIELLETDTLRLSAMRPARLLPKEWPGLRGVSATSTAAVLPQVAARRRQG